MEVENYIRKIKIPTSICVMSKRNSGKSVFVNDLVQQLLVNNKVDSVIVFSATAMYNNDYKNIPKSHILQYSDNKIRQIMNLQKKKPVSQRNQVLVVLDDLLGSVKNSDEILKLYSLGRHFNITPVLISQTANRLISPTIKNNSDHMFISRLNRQQLTDLWKSCITNMSKKSFEHLVETLNKNFNFIAIDNTTQSNLPEDFLTICYAKI